MMSDRLALMNYNLVFSVCMFS